MMLTSGMSSVTLTLTPFSGSHITEVLQENEALRQHLDLLKLQSEQEKKALKANVKRTEDELCRYCMYWWRIKFKDIFSFYEIYVMHELFMTMYSICEQFKH